MAQMKERIKTPEKELSDKAVANLSDAEFQTLVIRMLTGMIELGCKKKEEMKSIQSEIKENIQGARREGEETGTQTKDLKQNEEIDTQPEQNEQTRIQKNEERLRKLWDNCQRSNVRIIGVPEGEEEEQEIENFCEEIMTDNFSNLAREMDFQEVQEAH